MGRARIGKLNSIRYANCWEDADVLLNGLNPQPGDRLLSIGSGGDNSFSLLTRNPGEVVIVDNNPAQLYLIELKTAAIGLLDYDNLLGFLGYRAGKRREEHYRELRRHLSEEARSFWDLKPDWIESGVIHCGKFESYFQLFSKWVIPLIHGRATIYRLQESKSVQAQEEFYEQSWNTMRWRLLFRLFFSRAAMAKLGRDPAYFGQVGVSVADFVFKRAEQHLKSRHAQGNHMLAYNLRGDFDGLLPHYLRPENYVAVKKNLDRISYYRGNAEEACLELGQFNKMNLSNIFEYLNEQEFRRVADILVRHLLPNGKMAYWNLMVPRLVSGITNGTLLYEKELSDELSAVDKGFYYQKFILEIANGR